MTRVHRLDEVCDIVMGQAPPGTSYNADAQGVPLIAGAGDFYDIHPRPTKFTTEPGKTCSKGDVILAIRATIGERVVADRDYCLGRGVAGLRPGPSLDARYLWHWLAATAPTLNAKAKGATFKQVNREDIGSLPISLPDLSEQRRIAAILDQADALRAKRRAALAQLDALAESIFIDMFGDPATNPKRWPDGHTLDEFAEIVSGIAKGRRLNGVSTRVVPYLAVVNVQKRALDLSVAKTIAATESEIEKLRLAPGDLLLTEGGDADKLGRGTLWNNELPECIHQNHIFRVRITADTLRPTFLNWLVSSSRGRQYFLRSAKQTTGIASINMTQLRQFPVLLPPTEDQDRFASCISVIDRLKTSHRKSLDSLDALFFSVRNSAFGVAPSERPRESVVGTVVRSNDHPLT
jgi:type I restriction enzyme S subunit